MEVGEIPRRVKIDTGSIEGWISARTRLDEALIIKITTDTQAAPDVEVGGEFEVVSLVTVRASERLDSEVIGELKPGTVGKLMEVSGRRGRVGKEGDKEFAEGWISMKTRHGEALIIKKSAGSGPPPPISLKATIARGNLEALVEIVEGDALGWNLNCADIRGKTPLIYASAFGHKQIVDYLLSEHAKPFSAQFDLQSDGVRVCISSLAGDSVMEHSFALQATLQDLCNTMRSTIPSFVSTRIVFLTGDGIEMNENHCLKDHERLTVKQVLAELDINLMDGTQKTALHHASKGAIRRQAGSEDSTQVETVKALIEHGAYIEAREHNGCTALQFALANGDQSVVSALLEARADAKAKDYEGHTAVDYAKIFGFNNLLDLLKSHGAVIEEDEYDDVANSDDG